MHRRLHAAPRSTEERCFSQRGEKFAAEIGEDRRKVAHGGVAALEKGPDAAVERFDAAQGQHEIAGVAPVEGAVDEGAESRQLALRGVAHEIGRGIVHVAHQAVAVTDDCGTAAPGDGGGEEAGDLPVGTARVAVRHGDGVVRNELRAVVPVVEPLEQLAQRPAIRESGHRTW